MDKLNNFIVKRGARIKELNFADKSGRREGGLEGNGRELNFMRPFRFVPGVFLFKDCCE